MSTPTWGLDPKSRRITVYYEGTSTIREGMPLCYNFDTTTNWLGVESIDFTSTASTITESTTTAEGYQNEGKFIRVEDPATANLKYLAGFVAGADHDGEDGPKALDIYIPNGAIVPVRTDASTTVGATALGIADGETLCISGGTSVALAWETVDRSSTNGIVLAKISPDMFVQQNVTYNSLTGAVANTLQNTFSNTSGSACNLLVHTTVDGVLAASGNTWGILNYVSVDGSITVTTSYTRALLSQLNLSGTINASNAHLAAVAAQLSGSPTFTACSKAVCLWADIGLGVTPTSGDVVGLRISNNGSNQIEVTSGIELYGGYGINYLFTFDTCAGITGNFISNGGTGGAETGITSGGDWKKVKVDIDGTDYYLLAMIEPVEVDMVS